MNEFIRKTSLFVIALAFCSLFIMTKAAAQESDVRITGVMIDNDSLQPVSFGTVVVARTARGAVADADGHFSIIAQRGDTLLFSRVGFIPNDFIIPKDLMGDHYSMIKIMERDITVLEEVTIRPYPSYDEFIRAFIHDDATTGDMRMAKQLQSDIDSLIAVRPISEKYEQKDPWDGTMLYNTSDVFPENNLLNPLRWSEFISDWKKSNPKKKN